ncbi:MAG TPA: DMT family transporter [Geopsychrobacteraceae bacterium]|nr:DMT family transporter [Geopsychrobacteraceae bacterium]
MQPSRLGFPSLYLAIFLLSLTGLFAKLIPLDATSIIQLRSVVAAAGLALFIGLQKRSFRLCGIKTYVGVYALGLLLGLHWVTFFHAMQVSTVAVGMLAMFTFPVVTILLEPLFTKKMIKLGDICAGITVLVGLAIMVGSGPNDLQKPVTMGVISGTVSAVLFALRNLFQKYYFADETSDSLMFHQVVAVAFMLALFVDYPRVEVLQAVAFFKIFLLGILSTATAHTLLVYSLKLLPAKTVALIQCLQPPIAAVLAWLVVGETPGLSILIGGSVILSVAAYESTQKARTAQETKEV